MTGEPQEGRDPAETTARAEREGSDGATGGERVGEKESSPNRSRSKSPEAEAQDKVVSRRYTSSGA